jgi:hypothetical protein
MTQDDVFRLASKSEAGLTELGVTLAVAHCTVAQLTALRTTAEQKRQAFESSRSGKGQSYIDVRAARADAVEYLIAARDLLKARFGTSWGPLWAQLGFPGPGLEIPRKDQPRLHVLNAFKSYFLANPTHENAAFNITAARAEVVHDALVAKRQVVINCVQDVRAKREERDAAVAALLKKLRCLWAELTSILEPEDTRWLKFIDRIPGDPRVPEPVQEISATAQPGGIITLDWEDADRAARYRVFKQVVGVDAEPVLALTVDDSDAQLTGLPAGATVRLQIVATNSVGPAPASEVVQLQAA